MTVVRREDVPSYVASRDEDPFLKHNSSILTIVPLMIRRCSRSVTEPHHNFIPRLTILVPVLLTSSEECDGLQRRPHEAHELARNRHVNLRCRLMFRCQFAAVSTQSLLRLVRNRNHAHRLALAPPCECHPKARPVLAMPRDAEPRTSAFPVRDVASPMFLPDGVLGSRSGDCAVSGHRHVDGDVAELHHYRRFA